jgi:predicted ribosome quality control (RQC) complex YloA/Tae2 family protein
MVANYYTLRHIAQQLNQRLNQRLVRALFSQNKNELVIHIEDPDDQLAHAFLIVSCEPSNNFIFARHSFGRAKKNSVDLFPEVIGTTVQSVTIHPSDRQVTLQTHEGLRFVVQMFGSKANVLLVDARNRIVSSFLRPKETAGTLFTERDPTPVVQDHSSFMVQIRQFGETTVGVALKKPFPRFGNTLMKELLFRARIDESESADRLSGEEIGRLFTTGSDLISELENSCEPRIYFEGPSAVEFSIVSLRHLVHLDTKRFDSLDEAIPAYLGAVRSGESFAHEKTRVLGILHKDIEKTRHTLEKISKESESAARADQYEFWGKLLTAHLHELQRGMTEAVVENTFVDPTDPVEIPLDRNLTPAKNAERYFEKAKKARASVEEKRHYAEELRQHTLTLSPLAERLESVGSAVELQSFLDEHHASLVNLGIIKPRRTHKGLEETVPFRVFQVTGGFIVWAGKSGENNDLLSTRHTKAKDLWFHARGVGGSHVVLKHGTGKGEVSKQAIHEAAGIAAYYSKMKTSKLVPVAMCEGKYVRKPKGASPGTVTIEREKVIFVEPRLPIN